MLVVKALLWAAAFAAAAYVVIKAQRTGASGEFTRASALATSPTVLAVALLFPAVALLVTSSVGEIPAGAAGVVLRFGAATGEVKPPGAYAIVPFLTSIVPMDTQVRALQVEDAQAASRDLQVVHTDITLNYSLDPQKTPQIYSELRDDYTQRVITPATLEALKAATAKYTAAELITKRPNAQNDLQDELSGKLTKFGINVAAINITNFKFSDDYNKAVEAKVTAQQRALEAQQNLVRIQYEAQQTVTRAQAEAKALQLQRGAVTAELVRLREIEVERAAVEKWNGTLPQATNGMPFLNLNPVSNPIEGK